MAKLLQTNLPFATGPNVTAETFNQLVRTLEINLGSIDPDNTLQLTTAERDELNFNIGQIIYNTTTTTLQYWDGTNFQNISALGAVNLNVSDGSATIGINLNTQTLSLIGGTGITSNATGTSVTFAIDNTVATLTGTQTLTNKTLTSPTLTSPVLNGTLSGSAFLDEDNMASNSATAVASQQSIKAYVDSQVGTVDTLAEILANGNTTGGTDIAVSTGDSITFDDGSLISNGTAFRIDGAPGKEVEIFSARDIRFVIDDNNDDTNNTFQVFRHDTGSSNMVFEIEQDGDTNLKLGNLQIAGTNVILNSREIRNVTTLKMNDNNKILLGTSQDFEIFHNATNNILNGVNGDIVFQLAGSEKGRFLSTGFSVAGNVAISGNFNTSLGGYQVGGITIIDSSRNASNLESISMADSKRIKLGNADDLQIWHNVSDSRIQNNTGDLILDSTSIRIKVVGGSSNMITGSISGVSLFHNGNTKLQTTAAGITVTGTITSGAITSSGLVTADELSVTNDATFNGSVDATGQEVTAGTYVINNIAVNGSGSATTSATTQVAVDTVSKTAFRTVKYLVQITNSTDTTFHATEILVTHDGTTPSMTEYATIFTGTAEEATFSADISGSNLRLLATPASTDSMTFKITRTGIKV